MMWHMLLARPLLFASAARSVALMLAFHAQDGTIASCSCFDIIKTEPVEAAMSEMLVTTFAAVHGHGYGVSGASAPRATLAYQY